MAAERVSSSEMSVKVSSFGADYLVDTVQIVWAVTSGVIASLTAIAEDKSFFLQAVDPADEETAVFDIAVAVVDIVEPVAGLDTVDVGIGAALGLAVHNLASVTRIPCTNKGGIEEVPACTAYDITMLYHVACRPKHGPGRRVCLHFCLMNQRRIVTMGTSVQQTAHKQEGQQKHAHQHGSALFSGTAHTENISLSDNVFDQCRIGFLAQAIDKDPQSLIGHILIVP